MKDIYYLNISLSKKKMHVEVVRFSFKLSDVMPCLQPGGGAGVGVGGGGCTPMRATAGNMSERGIPWGIPKFLHKNVRVMRKKQTRQGRVT